MIETEAHDDDHCVIVKFDAEPWFREATDEQLASLDAEDYRWGYASDQIAIDLADSIPALAEMFKYIELRSRIETIGFAVAVDPQQAREWIAKNRSQLTLSEA